MSGPQSEQWRGAFGDDYVGRNRATDERIRQLTLAWARLLARLPGAPLRSILEVGANIGANLSALRRLSGAELLAVEPNAKARAMLVTEGVVPAANAFDATAQSLPLPDGAADLVFTSGVLIHIAPDQLLAACREIHRVARRFVVAIEYFSDRPEEIAYRGERGLLFKRDFGAFWLDNFSDLVALDCGFFWRRTTGLDNLTYWIFAKPSFASP